MFTGIVEETGKILEYKQNFDSAEIKIGCEKILEDAKIGDSIAIDGVCQTVCKLGTGFFCAQVSSETLKVTNFSKFKYGVRVNLERALTLQSRVGGHIVTGHVDAQAKLIDKSYQNEFCMLRFEVEKEFSKYIVQKGSVAINGVSLTVAQIDNNKFTIAAIPHTLANTTLNDLHTGDFVNLEVDILSKYVEKFLSRENNNVINEEFLKANGF